MSIMHLAQRIPISSCGFQASPLGSVLVRWGFLQNSRRSRSYAGVCGSMTVGIEGFHRGFWCCVQ